jgi:hypothetical protein
MLPAPRIRQAGGWPVEIVLAVLHIGPYNYRIGHPIYGNRLDDRYNNS